MYPPGIRPASHAYQGNMTYTSKGGRHRTGLRQSSELPSPRVTAQVFVENYSGITIVSHVYYPDINRKVDVGNSVGLRMHFHCRFCVVVSPCVPSKESQWCSRGELRVPYHEECIPKTIPAPKTDIGYP